MECGPLNETLKSPIGHLFDEKSFVMVHCSLNHLLTYSRTHLRTHLQDVYGSGNNFAHGHYFYGPKYRDSFEEGLRNNAEKCDSLQTFIVTHSLGGGTGSGVGI